MRRENIHKLIHLFLLALFLGYYGSITFFSHYHVINGVTIVHSHIFCGQSDSDGTTSHTHTAKEITLIAHLSAFVTLVTAALAVTAPYLVHKRTYHIQERFSEPDKQFYTLSLLRAPPASA